MGSERRNTLPLKFKLPRVDTLIALRSKITPWGSQAGTEDHDGDFFMPRNESVYEPFGPPQTELERKLKMMDERVDMIKTMLLEVKEQLLLRNVFPGCTFDCAQCENTPRGCGKLKKGIKLLIDQGIFLVEHSSSADEVSTLEIPYYLIQIPVENAPTTPLMIKVSTLFPYESTKVVPWNYNSIAYLYGQRLEERSSETQKNLVIHVPSEVSKTVGTQKFMGIQKLAEIQKPVEAQELVINITGASGMTRSGRIFAAPPPPLEKENIGANAKNMG
ncbi:hypothetical protein KIW84_033498 [Lathyrus oleraceus]|uniref:Uncharacterized protein n=1 Tax=Pisum sativum TaxID=3888 RepID=A0A9D4XVZ5_PEA|nr:hypothetical protein KIW84_033498 [Pisum sativum]